MQIRIRHLVSLALLVGAAYGGVRYEATQIQRTCEASDAPTVLNGTAYVCLTSEQANRIRAALSQRGT